MLARLLVPSEFGVVAGILVFVTFVELISDVGMKAAVVYEQSTPRQRLDVAFTLNVALALSLVVLGIVAAPAVAGFFGLEHRVGLFRLAALNPLLLGFGNVHDATLMRGLEFRRRAIPEAVRALSKATTQIGLAVAGLGASALIIGLLVGSLAWSTTLWLLTGYRPRPRMERAAGAELLRYGVPASALQVLAVVTGRIDVVVIARVLGERALGLYSIAFRVPELLIEGVAWTVSMVAFPSLSRERIRNEGGIGAMTAELVRWQAVYALPTAAALAVLSPSVIVVLFGSAWREAAGVLSGIAVATAIASVTFALGDAFKATARQPVLVVMSLVNLPISVAVMVLTAPAGIVAVAWARAGTRLLFGTALLAVAARTTGMAPRPLLAAAGPGAAAALGVAAGSALVRALWPTASLATLLAGGAAGALGGALTLRLLAPGTSRDLWRVARRRQTAARQP